MNLWDMTSILIQVVHFCQDKLITNTFFLLIKESIRLFVKMIGKIYCFSSLVLWIFLEEAFLRLLEELTNLISRYLVIMYIALM